MKDRVTMCVAELSKRVIRLFKEVRRDLDKLDAKAKTPAQREKFARFFDQYGALLEELESKVNAFKKVIDEFDKATDKIGALDNKINAELKKIGSSKPKAKKAKAKKASKK